MLTPGDLEIEPLDVLPLEESSIIVPANRVRIEGYYSNANKDRFIYQAGPGELVKDIDLLYSTKWFYRLMCLRMSGLISEYLSFFVLLPFESIRGRPSICIISLFYLLIACLLGFFLHISGSAIIPTKWSHMANILSVIIQFLAGLLNVWAVVSTLLTKLDFITDYRPEEGGDIEHLSMTTYVQLTTILCLVASLWTLMFSLAGAIIYGKGYYRFSHRVCKMTKRAAFYKRQFAPGGDIRDDSATDQVKDEIEMKALTKDIERMIEDRFS